MIDDVDTPTESELLAAARRGDSAAFERLVAGHRSELFAHCYRMLGSVQDAEDALQESFLGAWRGMAGFEGRSSMRAWLYRVSTNACLRLIARRPGRMLSVDYGRPRRDTHDLREPVAGPVWLEPCRTRCRRASRATPTRKRAICGGRAWSWPSSRRCSICRVPSERY